MDNCTINLGAIVLFLLAALVGFATVYLNRHEIAQYAYYLLYALVI